MIGREANLQAHYSGEEWRRLQWGKTARRWG